MSEWDWYMFGLYTLMVVGGLMVLAIFVEWFFQAYDEWRNEE